MRYKCFAKTQFLGKKIGFLPKCPSTNTVACDWVKKSPQPEGLTLITPHQTHGKGQRGSVWEADPNKNITFSIVLKPAFIPVSAQFQLHIITTLAIYDVLFPQLGEGLKIKWPNDIYYQDKKLGGLLIENIWRGSVLEYAIVGIGINVNQLQFNTPKAVSLRAITAKTYDLYELIENLLVSLEAKYLKLKHGDIAALKAEYISNLYRFGENQRYQTRHQYITGKIVGISPSGKLQIATPPITHEFDFKEVRFC